MISNERKEYLKKRNKKILFINISRILLFIFLIIIWEILSRKKIIDPFLFSSPSKICNTIIDLYYSNNLFTHVFTTLKEIIISFILGNIIGFVISSILYLALPPGVFTTTV